MSFDQHTNFAYSTLQASSGVIGSTSGTTLIIAASGDMPDPAVGQYNIVVWPASLQPLSSNAEIMRATAKSGTTLIVIRAQEGTTALSGIAAGYQVALTMTSKLLTDLEAAGPKCAIIQYQKTSGTDGGSAATGAFTKYPLNTIVSDPNSITSLSSNQVTLAAGTYIVIADIFMYEMARVQLRLQNVTDSTTAALGVNQFIANGTNTSSNAMLYGLVTITGSKTFELQYRAGNSQGGNDLGIANSYGTEVYGNLTVTKIG